MMTNRIASFTRPAASYAAGLWATDAAWQKLL